MFRLLKIGYLVGFMVIKNMPDYDSFLVKLIDSEILALLPREWARKVYKVGETGWAAIFSIEGTRTTLSQKSPQYVRKMLEYLLSDASRLHNFKFKKVAGQKGFPFYKIAIEPLGNGIKTSKDLFILLKPYLEKIRFSDYFGEGEKFSFVKYSHDVKEYVINALCPPASPEMIWKVIYYREMNKVDIITDNKYVGVFMGKKGGNVFTASKLCGVEIEVKGISNETYNKFNKRRSTWKAY